MTCDTAFIRISRTADEVFAFMSDPGQMSLWSFGTWRTEIDAGGLVCGTSIRDGSVICARVEAHPDQGLIDYHLGRSPDALFPRVFVRVTSEEVFGDGKGAGLAMTAFRTAGMDDAHWGRLKATHLVELDLIKSALETGYDHRSA